jgi:hypothetical protein
MSVLNELYNNIPRISKYVNYEVTENNKDHFFNDLYKLEEMLTIVEGTKDVDFGVDIIRYDKAGAIRMLKLLIGEIQFKLSVFYLSVNK